MILYEPALAKENGGLTWGGDKTSIRYPSVNTCLTLTLVYPSKLVGAHFGLLTPQGTPVGAENVSQTLNQMDSLRPHGEGVNHALLIGNHGIWFKDAATAYQTLYLRCSELDDDFDPTGWDTELLKTVDIEVFKRGLITIRKTDGSQVVMKDFNGAGTTLPSNVKRRLGI